MKVKGSELIFLSRLSSDGNELSKCSIHDSSNLKNEEFNVNRLSITEQTYIASGFNTYIVKLKPPTADVASIIIKQIEFLFSLNLEPKHIEIQKEYFEILEKQFQEVIASRKDGDKIQSKINYFMGLEIIVVDNSNYQFSESEGFPNPIQVTVKKY